MLASIRDKREIVKETDDKLKAFLERLHQEVRLRARQAPMPSLKTFRLRIRSVQSTQKITKAMKMVAAAKLRRAQEQADGGPSLCRGHGQHAGLAGRMLQGRHRAPAAGRHRLGPGPSADRRHRPTAACAAPSTARSCARRGAPSARCWPRARRSRCWPSAARAATSCAATSPADRRDHHRSRPAAARLRRRARRSPSASWRCSRPASSTSPRWSSTASSRR